MYIKSDPVRVVNKSKVNFNILKFIIRDQENDECI